MKRKPIFDTVRRLLGRSFHTVEIAELDAAIDAALTTDLPSRQLGAEGVALIKRWEGCAKRRPDGRFEAYPDPGTGGAPWTIGWGSTGPDIFRGLNWSQAECDERFKRDLARFERDVDQALGDAPTSQAQFDALVSFHYNTGAIRSATLTKRHVAGDFDGAAGEFARWVHAGGKRLTGLVRRRADEASLYRSG